MRWRDGCGQGIERAVEAQLVSDVPVGIFLCGGDRLVAGGGGRRAARRDAG